MVDHGEKEKQKGTKRCHSIMRFSSGHTGVSNLKKTQRTRAREKGEMAEEEKRLLTGTCKEGEKEEEEKNDTEKKREAEKRKEKKRKTE